MTAHIPKANLNNDKFYTSLIFKTERFEDWVDRSSLLIFKFNIFLSSSNFSTRVFEHKQSIISGMQIKLIKENNHITY